MKKYILENAFVSVSFLSLGATIYSFKIKQKNDRNIMLSTKDLKAYKTPANGYFGATVGPVAGRIANGEFVIDGKQYNASMNEKVTNSLHGGFDSFAFKEFELVEQDDTQLTFKYVTGLNEGGYPGIMTIIVEYNLLSSGLAVKYTVTGTEKTLVNITNHGYFNLDGHGNILDHTLKMPVHAVYELDDIQINIAPIDVKKWQLFDLKDGKKLKEIVLDPALNKMPTMGLDHLLLVDKGILVLENKDLILSVKANTEAFQLYSTNFPPDFILESGEKINLYHGLAIEPVSVVSSTDKTYANLELAPGEKYIREIVYDVKIKN